MKYRILQHITRIGKKIEKEKERRLQLNEFPKLQDKLQEMLVLDDLELHFDHHFDPCTQTKQNTSYAKWHCHLAG
jgi:hypothetical protein